MLAAISALLLFNYVLGQGFSTFGMQDLTESMDEFMKRQLKDEMNSPAGPSENLGGGYRSPLRSPFNFEDRIPGPPDTPNEMFNAPSKQPLIAGRFQPGPAPNYDPSHNWGIGKPERNNYRNRPLEQPPSQPYSGSKQEAVRDINLLGSRLTATGKWQEFLRMANEVKRQGKGRPPGNWENDAFSLAQYSKNLMSSMPRNENRLNLRPENPKPISRFNSYMPSPGMDAYWNENDKPKPITPKPGPRQPVKIMSGEEVMNMALKKIADFQRSENTPMTHTQATAGDLSQNNSIGNQHLSVNQNIPPPGLPKGEPDDFKQMPKYDDFNSPIRWVPLYSNETSDGLARVTDPKTGRNQQYVINGTVMVPVIDHSVQRLGWTSSTTTATTLAGDPAALRTVVQNLDLKNVDERDWLAYEVALGNKMYDHQCEGDGCQARCNRLGCESKCSGDTCASGCVGGSCSTMCNGPGCLSMCIGESCSARCSGISCEARCRGSRCEADCGSFSCVKIANGAPALGGGTFDQHYPQYGVSGGRHQAPGDYQYLNNY